MCFSLLFGVRDLRYYLFFFFFNDTATTEIYTLSLHDALPICLVTGVVRGDFRVPDHPGQETAGFVGPARRGAVERSEEHTSELQSPCKIVCRLLLEKKKKNKAFAVD